MKIVQCWRIRVDKQLRTVAGPGVNVYWMVIFGNSKKTHRVILPNMEENTQMTSYDFQLDLKQSLLEMGN